MRRAPLYLELGRIVNAADPRVVQLAAKLSFSEAFDPEWLCPYEIERTTQNTVR